MISKFKFGFCRLILIDGKLLPEKKLKNMQNNHLLNYNAL